MTERVLGPSGSKRRRTRLLVLTALATAAFAVFFVVGAGAVTGSPSGFESADGNMVLNTTDGTATDWNCFVGTDNFQTGSPNANCKVKTGAVHAAADPGNVEITWKPGQKFDTLCPVLQPGNVPNKDDFTHIAEYQEFGTSGTVSGDLFFYGASIRLVSNGNASGDVEFNQESGDGTTTAGCRSAGDRLVAYDFLNGGTSLDFHVLTWITPQNLTAGGNDGTCFVKNSDPPCWGAHVIDPAADASTFDGQTNLAEILAANNKISGEQLDAQRFAEFGINLTLALTGVHGTALPCFPQQVWESRSSGSSFVSSPEDIEFLHLSTCGALKVVKTAKNKLLGSGDKPQSGVTFTVKQGTTDVATLLTGTDGTACTDSLAPGAYTVTETVPDNYRTDSTNPQTATVVGGTTCDGTGSTAPTTKTFHNIPQSLIRVTFHSKAGVGVTTATINCTGDTAGVYTDLPDNSTGRLLDNLDPGTYSCTVIVDP